MKGTSVYTPKVTMSDKKTSPLRERLKSLTLSQIIMSAFSGIISQGTLVGVIKPFGPAFYAAYSGSITVKKYSWFCLFFMEYSTWGCFIGFKANSYNTTFMSAKNICAR